MSLIDDPYLARMADQIEAKIGLVIEKWQYGFLLKSIEKRIEALRLSGLSEYWKVLKQDNFQNSEFQTLVNFVTNNETFFFRIPQQYTLIQQQLLPGIRRSKPNHELRIWSAGCSSGEEIYTLAMILKDESSLWSHWRIKLFATDISESILEKAKQGLFSQRSVQYVPPHLKERFFKQDNSGSFQLSQEIRGMVSFGYFNLAESLTLENRSAEGRTMIQDMDLILFRNVMIYFKFDTITTVMESFSKILNPSGYLLLGPAETLWKVSDLFVPKTFGDLTVYQRADSVPAKLSPLRRPEAQEPAKRDSSFEKRVKIPSENNARTRLKIVELLQKREKSVDPDKTEAKAKAQPVRIVQEPLDLLKELLHVKNWMDSGDWDAALSRAEYLLDSNPDSSDLNFLLTLIYDQKKDQEKALHYCRRVIYLKGDLLFARLIYARLLEKDGKHKESLIQYREIMRRHLKGRGSSLEYYQDFVPFDNQRVFFEAKRMLEKG